jgi:L-arabinose 1- dehydrogenase
MLWIGIVGLGEIASRRHVPAIAAQDGLALAGIASPDGAAVPGVPAWLDHRDLLAAEVDAIAICTPPSVRFRIAADALAVGKHVLLEKPPTATPGELAALVELARERRLTLFTAWHSQFNPAVDRAREMLAGRRLARLAVTWKEDVEAYHPGQRWIWQPAGFGVFDPGVNALSILTRILPQRLLVTGAALTIEDGAATPVKAELAFATVDGDRADLRAAFDWRHPTSQREIELEATDGLRLRLADCGRRLEADGRLVLETPNDEYGLLYRHFHALLAAGRSDIDAEPLRLAADAHLVASRLSAA